MIKLNTSHISHNLFFTSDTHFGHKGILRFNPKTRPFSSTDEMDAHIIETWNSQVTPNDTVFHLGDFAFMNIEQIKSVIRQLNGKIFLVLGNHDQHIRHNAELQRMFRGVGDLAELRLANNQKTVCCHYAMRVWNGSHYGSFMLYGHSHGNLPGIDRSMDVGWDTSDLGEDHVPALIPYETIYNKLIKLGDFK